jgi:oligoribonuclease NrnB/cAMP/cGMP phosphodiesterase (DHH superfamily)
MSLSFDKIRNIREIVVHAHCADGMASALILRDVLPRANIRFIQYDTPEHKQLKPEAGLLFCDFSPHRDSVKTFVDAGAVVLDHHKSQKDVVEAFGENGIYADEKDHPGVCGAVLAYAEVWRRLMLEKGVLMSSKNEALCAERFALDIGVYDTWQRTDPGWTRARRVTELMHFYSLEHWPSGGLFSFANEAMWAERMDVAALLVEKKDVRVQKAIENSFVFTTAKGTRVLLFDGVAETSDAAEMLGDKNDLIVGFKYVVQNGCVVQLRFSTRSHTGFDCLALAKRYGGGGHTAAAGFSLHVDQHRHTSPYKMLVQLLAVFETEKE